jgi:hypothetical protein
MHSLQITARRQLPTVSPGAEGCQRQTQRVTRWRVKVRHSLHNRVELQDILQCIHLAVALLVILYTQLFQVQPLQEEAGMEPEFRPERFSPVLPPDIRRRRCRRLQASRQREAVY